MQNKIKSLILDFIFEIHNRFAGILDFGLKSTTALRSFLISSCLLIPSFSFANLQSLDRSEQAIFPEIKNLLETSYLYPQKIPSWDFTSISGYLAQLQDPHTDYFSPSQAKKLLALLDNRISGIGAVLKLSSENLPIIAKVLPSSPAQKAGLQAGDLIIAVNGKHYQKDQDFNLFLSEIRGEIWSSLSLQIDRQGKVYLYTLTRANIQIPTVDSLQKDRKCYFIINNFDKGSADQLISQLKSRQNCDFHIFDLRGNPGGIVEEVLKALETFIPQDSPLLTIKTKDFTQTEKAQKADFHLIPRKTLILIDNATASAAEIFAWVLKHYFPATTYLIGDTSHGKGSMQEVHPLSNGWLLKYTLALRTIADQSTSIDKIGLTPDLKLSDNPETPQDELLTALKLIP